MGVISNNAILFSLESHPLHGSLCNKLPAAVGNYSFRHFPDGESYLRIDTPVEGQHCMILAELSHPDGKFLPMIFLAETLRELGAASVGLIAPYLSYMRQDRRFVGGEAVTSRIFARQVSLHIDWLVTVDPHLHRYHSLDEIYSVPSLVVHGAPLISQWLSSQKDVFLVGPDNESKQWVSQVADRSGHPYVVGEKQRHGDRDVVVSLPDLKVFRGKMAVIIDDVISSGQTLFKCIDALRKQNIEHIACAAVHGIFADDADNILMAKGITELVTTNSVPHCSNKLDLTDTLLVPIESCLVAIRKSR